MTSKKIKNLFLSIFYEFEGKGSRADEGLGGMTSPTADPDKDEESLDDAFQTDELTTQVSLHSIFEQMDAEPNPDAFTKTPDSKQMVTGPTVDPQAAEPNIQDPNMAGGMDPNIQDPNMMAGGMDPNMAGGMGAMPGEEPKSLFDVGRTYELKRIYYRLVSVKDYLSGSLSPFLLKLRSKVAVSVELFQVLIDNFQSYEDAQIDEMIVLYYEFLERVYAVLNFYYKKSNVDDKKDKNDLWEKIIKIDKKELLRFKDIKRLKDK